MALRTGKHFCVTQLTSEEDRSEEEEEACCECEDVLKPSVGLCFFKVRILVIVLRTTNRNELYTIHEQNVSSSSVECTATCIERRLAIKAHVKRKASLVLGPIDIHHNSPVCGLNTQCV